MSCLRANEQVSSDRASRIRPVQTDFPGSGVQADGDLSESFDIYDPGESAGEIEFDDHLQSKGRARSVGTAVTSPGEAAKGVVQKKKPGNIVIMIGPLCRDHENCHLGKRCKC